MNIEKTATEFQEFQPAAIVSEDVNILFCEVWQFSFQILLLTSYEIIALLNISVSSVKFEQCGFWERALHQRASVLAGLLDKTIFCSNHTDSCRLLKYFMY